MGVRVCALVLKKVNERITNWCGKRYNISYNSDTLTKKMPWKKSSNGICNNRSKVEMFCNKYDDFGIVWHISPETVDVGDYITHLSHHR